MTDRSASEPSRIDRPGIPPEYGAGKGDEYVAWSHVERRLIRDRVVWLATVTDDGRPRVRPVDSLYVDGFVWVGGSPETAWVRDVTARSPVTVHLDGTDDVAILEGDAEILSRIDGELAERLAAASREKFPEYAMTADAYRRGAIRIRPRKVIAWTNFVKDPTRFRFEAIGD